MKKYPVLSQLILFSILFAFAHKIALHFSIYWTINGFDSVMHTFGGFIGALLVIYVLEKIGISPQTKIRKIILLLFVVVSVLAVGSIWELWEIFIGFTNPFTDLVDTMSDLVMDIIGSIIGFIYYEKRLKSKTE